MTKLELLHALKSKKFDQLCALVARELGYDQFSILTVEDRIRVEDQATQHVELWEETVEMKTNFTIRPITPLRRLLAEYHDICEKSSTSMKLTSVFGPTEKGLRGGAVQRRFRTQHLRAAETVTCRPQTSRPLAIRSHRGRNW